MPIASGQWWYDIMHASDVPVAVDMEITHSVETERRVWSDVVEEPYKYGDDTVDWLELDEKLAAAPGRWRLAAHWYAQEALLEEHERELQTPWREIYSSLVSAAAIAGERRWWKSDMRRIHAKMRADKERVAKAKAAVKIQAAWRGHRVRYTNPHLDCCMCLAHRIAPLLCYAGMMCRDCYTQGPYKNITGPVADEWNWIRAEAREMNGAKPGEKHMCKCCGDKSGWRRLCADCDI